MPTKFKMPTRLRHHLVSPFRHRLSFTMHSPLLQEKVYVGMSAGSMLVTPTFGEKYDGIDPPTGSDKALGLVDFALHPHLDAEYMPTATLAHLEQWAAGVDVPAYAIDDQTAIKVTGGDVSFVSEDHWKRFVP